MGALSRDIDPGELAKGYRKKEHFSTSRKQMARDTGPPTSPFLSRGREGRGEERATDRVQSSKSTPRRNPGGGPSPSRFLPDALFRPPPPSLSRPPYSSTKWQFDCCTTRSRASGGPRCPLPELLYAAFGVNVHLLLLRPSLSELSTDGTSEIWLSGVCDPPPSIT